MRRILILFTYLFFVSPIFSSPIDSITKFNINICETYGCDAFVTTYINYKYENDEFSITYVKDNAVIKKEIFKKEIFQIFYDSLLTFEFSNLKEKYTPKQASSASHFGNISIERNNKLLKSINYLTLPDDSTNFMYLHQWLTNKAQRISSDMNLKKLLGTNFYNLNCLLNDYPAILSIEKNINNYNINEIIKTIDTTTNDRLKTVMISSLAYFNDSNIIIKLGNMLIKNIKMEDEKYCSNCPMKNQLNPILKQDSSLLKITYLKKFLSAKDKYVQLESSKALAFYGYNEGGKVISGFVNVSIINNECCLDSMNILALVKISDENILKELINNYKKIKIKKVPNKRTLSYLIVAINAILDNKKSCDFGIYHISNDEEWRKRINEAILNLDARIKNK